MVTYSTEEEKKKKRLLVCLNDLQKAIASQPTEAFLRLDADLSFQYQNLLHQEEDFWALKSRLQWANFGDRNTTFFHISTIGKRHHNKILCLKNQNGEWSNSPVEMKQIVQSYFVGLYTTGFESSARAIPWPEVHNTFPQDICSTLMQEVSPAEIKNAIMSFKPFKSPGPDGLYPVFFQKFWDTLGPSVTHFIKIFSDRGKFQGT